jgi:hypothetical protein
MAQLGRLTAWYVRIPLQKESCPRIRESHALPRVQRSYAKPKDRGVIQMQKRSVLTVLAALLLSTSLMFSQNPLSGNPHGQGSLAVPISGQLTAPASGPLSSLSGALTGVFNITHFAVQNNASGTPTLMAVGSLVGTVTNAAGASTVALSNVTAPVAAATGSCSILSLTLGPLDLNVLGLDVNIPNPVVVNIVAQQGPGNLLGNLLCSVAGLLNNGGLLGGGLSQITGLLNSILGVLGV